MLHFDLNFNTPAEHLAADEALLDWCESGQGRELLAFWEPKETFVVVGYANKVSTEVNTSECEKRRVPIFRRSSGGGTVLQMPGGLNYTLILAIHETGPTRNITSSNKYVMEKNCAAIQNAIGGRSTISIQGHTDLALVTHHASRIIHRKFAGNSQRRRKHFLLFHGTFLLNCNLELISELLLMPSLQPGYRASRPHEEFVTNLPLPAAAVKEALAREWKARPTPGSWPQLDIAALAKQKYETSEWNCKF